MSEALEPSTDPPRESHAERLRLAIGSAFHGRGEQEITEELRNAVCAYVRDQRAAGTRAEEVIIAVKRIIDLAEFRPIRTLERRALTERVVTWCISEYYRAD